MFCKRFGIVEISWFTIKNGGKNYHSDTCKQTPFIRQPLILRGSLAQEHCSMSLQYCVQCHFEKTFQKSPPLKLFESLLLLTAHNCNDAERSPFQVTLILLHYLLLLSMQLHSLCLHKCLISLCTLVSASTNAAGTS